MFAELVFSETPNRKETVDAIHVAFFGRPGQGNSGQIERRLKIAFAERDLILVVEEFESLNNKRLHLVRTLQDFAGSRLTVFLVGDETSRTEVDRDRRLSRRILTDVHFAPMSLDAVLKHLPSYHPLFADAKPSMLAELYEESFDGNWGDIARWTRIAEYTAAERTRVEAHPGADREGSGALLDARRGGRRMISSIADRDVDPALIDELRQHDPVFGGTIVVEPFPEAGLQDVLGELHAELAVSAAVSQEQITRGAALEPLSQSAITTLVILGADALAESALRDFSRLRDFDLLQDLVLVTSVAHHVHEQLADACTPSHAVALLYPARRGLLASLPSRQSPSQSATPV